LFAPHYSQKLDSVKKFVNVKRSSLLQVGGSSKMFNSLGNCFNNLVVGQIQSVATKLIFEGFAIAEG